MAFIEQKNRFTCTNVKAKPVFTEDQFFRWTDTNFFRTSYNDMTSKVIFNTVFYIIIFKQSPVEKKNHAIPGYKGFVPNIRSSSLYGKPYTEQTRGVLKKELLDTDKNGMATTGFNVPKAAARRDLSLHAVSNKYGRPTMMQTAKNFHPAVPLTTQIRETFESPMKNVKPNWRQRNGTIQFD